MEIVKAENVVSEAEVNKLALEMISESWLKTQGPQIYAKNVQEMVDYYQNKARIKIEKERVK